MLFPLQIVVFSILFFVAQNKIRFGNRLLTIVSFDRRFFCFCYHVCFLRLVQETADIRIISSSDLIVSN